MRVLLPLTILLLQASSSVCWSWTGKTGYAGAHFTRISSKDGLADDNVHVIFQDKLGFLWIGTRDGLCLYDGVHIKTFRHNPLDDNSISNNSVLHIAESENGVLWLGTWGGGLTAYHRNENRFVRYFDNPDQQAEDTRIQSLYLDEQGLVWAGTFAGGLLRLDPETGAFKTWVHEIGLSDSLPDNRVWTIAEARPGYLWVGTNAGLGLLHMASERFTIIYRHNPQDPNSLSDNRVQTVLKDKAGRLWVGTKNGLNIMEAEGRFRHYKRDPNKPGGLPANDIRVLKQDSRGAIWIGVGTDHITLAEGYPPQFRPLELHPLEQDLAPEVASFKCAFEDRSQVMWLGSFTGLYKTDLKPRKFRHFFEVPGDPNSLKGNRISAIFEDSRRYLWIGTQDGLLNRLDRSTGTNVVKQVVDGGGIPAIWENGKNQIWVGTPLGLKLYDQDMNLLREYQNDESSPDSLSHNRVLCIAPADGDSFWVGTDRPGGLNLFIPNEERFINHHSDNFLRNKLGVVKVNAILKAGVRQVWAGTDRGLFFLDPENKLSRHYSASDDPTSLSQNAVVSLHQDRKGNLWIGTVAGLNLMAPGSDEFKRYFSRHGLPSDEICGILEDREDNIWISTRNGLSRFRPETGVFRNYDLADGLQGNGFTGGVAFRSPSGEMFFGGNNGFNSFFPYQVKDNPFKPAAVLTEVRISNQVLETDVPFWSLKSLVLGPDDRSLTLEFAALDFTNPAKNTYRYRLGNVNENWIEQRDSKISLGRLDPGKYVLAVNGANNDGAWSETSFKLDIEIKPPLYQTWWAYTLYFIAILLFAVGLPFLRIYRLKERQQILADMVAERTRELKAKNIQLNDVNQELISFDEIVQTINREVEMVTLLKVLLEQGVNLFSYAEAGWVLLYDQKQSIFKCDAQMGFENDRLSRLRLTQTEARERYIQGHEMLGEGIYLIKEPARLPSIDELDVSEQPLTMLVITIVVDNHVDGFLIFENYSGAGFFEAAELDKLLRFREHAISAVGKARNIRHLADTAEDLRQTQQRLLESAHKAGMAEVATNVLHNVGNALNGITTSAELISEMSHSSVLGLLSRISDLFEKNKDNLADYILNDKQGKKIPNALASVCESLLSVNGELRSEVKELIERVQVIRDELAEQMAHVSSDEFFEEVDVINCIDQVMETEKGLLESHRIHLHRDFVDFPKVRLPKAKFRRVLIALVTNAVEALKTRETERNITLRCGPDGDDAGFLLDVEDNGNGISHENRRHIFNQGFSTKRKASSYGLHYCANVVKEMGGQISCESGGPGMGSVFSLRIPNRRAG